MKRQGRGTYMWMKETKCHYAVEQDNAYLWFLDWMKWLWDASPSQGYTLELSIFKYTWVESCNVTLKCLAQEHNINDQLTKAQTWLWFFALVIRSPNLSW